MTRTQQVKGAAFEIVKAMPKVVKQFVDRYGDELIDKVSVARVPLASKIKTVLNLFTLGKLKQEEKRLGYDNLYHAYIVLTMQNGQRIMFQKNQRVEMYLDNGALEKLGAQVKNARSPRSLTLRQFIINAENHVPPEKLWYYNLFNSNCQMFINDVLDANGLNTPELRKFVLQDITSVVASSSWRGKLVTAVTDLAHKINAGWHGGELSTKEADTLHKKGHQMIFQHYGV